MSGVDHKTIAAGDDGMRLDHWFKHHYPDLGLGRLQKLLRTGQIRVDGGRVKAGHRLQEGQVLRIPPLGPPRDTKGEGAKAAKTKGISAEDRAFIQGLVLHRDDQVIVIDKPAGLAVQGGSNTKRHLDGLLDGLTFDKPEKPRLVHRLDKDTSGVLVLARDAKTAKHLSRAFQTKETRKLYWAVVVGLPDHEAGLITLPLLKQGGKGREKVVVHQTMGQKAQSLFEVIDHAGKRASWVALEPRTGRTHQLRVHMADGLGCPILGDGKYGGQEAFLDGGGLSRKVHLHARAIAIPHPKGGTITVMAEPPDHLKKTLSFFGFDAKDKEASDFLEDLE